MQVNTHMVVIPESETLDGRVVGRQVPGIPLILFPDRDPNAQVALLAYIESVRKTNPAQADEYMKLLEVLGIKVFRLRELLSEIQIETVEKL